MEEKEDRQDERKGNLRDLVQGHRAGGAARPGAALGAPNARGGRGLRVGSGHSLPLVLGLQTERPAAAPRRLRTGAAGGPVWLTSSAPSVRRCLVSAVGERPWGGREDGGPRCAGGRHLGAAPGTSNGRGQMTHTPARFRRAIRHPWLGVAGTCIPGAREVKGFIETRGPPPLLKNQAKAVFVIPFSGRRGVWDTPIMTKRWTWTALWTGLCHAKGTRASKGVTSTIGDRPRHRSSDDLALPGHQEAGPC